MAEISQKGATKVETPRKEAMSRKEIFSLAIFLPKMVVKMTKAKVKMTRKTKGLVERKNGSKLNLKETKPMV